MALLTAVPVAGCLLPPYTPTLQQMPSLVPTKWIRLLGLLTQYLRSILSQRAVLAPAILAIPKTLRHHPRPARNSFIPLLHPTVLQILGPFLCLVLPAAALAYMRSKRTLSCPFNLCNHCQLVTHHGVRWERTSPTQLSSGPHLNLVQLGSFEIPVPPLRNSTCLPFNFLDHPAFYLMFHPPLTPNQDQRVPPPTIHPWYQPGDSGKPHH